MSDVFADKHEADGKASDAAQRTSNQKAAQQQIAQRVAAKTAQDKRPANWDVGYKMRPKFYEPGA